MRLFMDYLGLQYFYTMEHKLILVSPCLPDSKEHSRSADLIVRITEEELDSLIVDYYSQVSSNAQNSFPNSLAAKYSQIEQEIRQVVEMRKDMEKLVEIDVMQSQHFDSMQRLINQNVQSQRTIEELSNKIREYESKKVEEMIAWLKSRLEAVQYSPNVCLSNEIIMLANQISRSFCNQYPHQSNTVQSYEFQMDSDIYNLKSQSQNELNSIIEQQNQKYELLKNIYGCRFKELSIRDELISEREDAFLEYTASNHQLIDALLREKEREKNLSRTQREKFEELLKARHQIQLENEHLNHHQNNLVSYYEIELTRLKEQISEREKEWNAQRELLLVSQSSKTQQIQKLMATIKEITLQKDQLRKELQNKNKLLQEDTHKTDQLKNEFEEKMESLQSQLNQNILKLSQSSRTKNELTHKLQQANKKIAEMQVLKNRINDLQGENHKNEEIKQQLQRKNQLLGNRGEASQSEIVNLQQKIQYLQNELTQSFILNNEQIKRLNDQIRHKDTLIQNLQSQRIDILRQIEQKRQLQPTTKNQPMDSQQQNRLKRELRGQLQRQSQMKQRLLDEAIERISNLLY